jgi:hypothetical protein
MSHGCVHPAGRVKAGGGEHAHVSEGRSVVSAMWIVGGVAAFGAIVAFIATRQRGGTHRDFGTVSTQWISEHRLGSNQDYPRR